MPTDELPAHASPAIRPRPKHSDSHPHISNLDINVQAANANVPPPPSILTPAFTPPHSPSSEDETSPQRLTLKRTRSIAVDTDNPSSGLAAPSLLEELPHVECIVRARIPTTGGREMFLHLYKNDLDAKEHLAIVFGSSIRSRSLDAEQPGETERDRMIRGAYVGRLFPGRTSSRLKELKGAEPRADGSGKASPLLMGMQKAKLEKVKEGDGEELPPPADLTARAASKHIPLVRIHSECYTGETVWSARCDCGEQLDEAARLMSEGLPDSEASTPSIPAVAGVAAIEPGSTVENDEEDEEVDPGGVIIYLRQEGRGIGLSEKLKAYNLQDLGSDTYEANLLLRHPADARSYGLATAMLVDLGLGGERGIRLLTNNPDKIRAVEGPNKEVRVRERVAMVPIAWRTGGKEGVRGKEVEGYLRAKIDQFGHLLDKPV